MKRWEFVKGSQLGIGNNGLAIEGAVRHELVLKWSFLFTIHDSPSTPKKCFSMLCILFQPHPLQSKIYDLPPLSSPTALVKALVSILQKTTVLAMRVPCWSVPWRDITLVSATAALWWDFIVVRL